MEYKKGRENSTLTALATGIGHRGRSAAIRNLANTSVGLLGDLAFDAQIIGQSLWQQAVMAPHIYSLRHRQHVIAVPAGGHIVVGRELIGLLRVEIGAGD